MNSGTSTVEKTPVLTLTCSPAVALAAVGLVAVKDQMDALSRSAAGGAIVGQIFPDCRTYRTLDPHSFAAKVIPFYWYARSKRLSNSSTTRYLALVPTSTVVGDSWRWSPAHLNDREQEKVIEKAFSAFAASSPERAESECAQYTHIRPLGLVLAHEGKNRVALFKERQLAHIPAMVWDEEYVAPERLRIFELAGTCLAVLDGRFVERVVALHLVRELVEAYGVEVERRWPEDFAELKQVLHDLDDSSTKFHYLPYATDMDKLRLDAACHDAEVEATLLDIGAVRFPPLRAFLHAAVALLLLLLGVGLCARRWPDMQLVLATAAGALGMLLIVPVLPLVRCKVRYLKDSERMRHFFELRHHRTRAQQRAAADLGS
ncbi:hypothetical protein [Massilia sp. KIM]|uniref:hypothetical protein n=1 Tax=Massilia sp. KIM TaxID=1955422 RepID=UPI00117DB398|nr:hypothetical protein [Massilia sp. KIM]